MLLTKLMQIIDANKVQKRCWYLNAQRVRKSQIRQYQKNIFRYIYKWIQSFILFFEEKKLSYTSMRKCTFFCFTQDRQLIIIVEFI